MKKIIIDTNFFLIPARFKIDIISEIERLMETAYIFIVPSCVENELRSIAGGKGRYAMAARFALEVMRTKPTLFMAVRSRKEVKPDDWILHYAAKEDAIVCTNDRKLRKRLKEAYVKVISMKSRSKIGFV